MKYILLIFIVIAISNTSFCQSTEQDSIRLEFDVSINENLGADKLIVIVRFTSKLQRGRWDPATFIIVGKENDTISYSDLGSFKIFSDEKRDFEFVDINFDGYKDVLINMGYSANGMNRFYSLIFFDPSKNIFFFNDSISELLGTNTEIDSVNNVVQTFVNSYLGGASSETYKYIKGEWKLIRSE